MLADSAVQRTTVRMPISVNEETPGATHQGDEEVDFAAVEEPMRPRPLGGHHAGIFARALGANLLAAERTAIVLRAVALGQPGAVGGRVELGRLLEDEGSLLARLRRLRRGVPNRPHRVPAESCRSRRCGRPAGRGRCYAPHGAQGREEEPGEEDRGRGRH